MGMLNQIMQMLQQQTQTQQSDESSQCGGSSQCGQGGQNDPAQMFQQLLQQLTQAQG